MSDANTIRAGRLPSPGPALGIVPFIVAGCMFMENLDATVIATALPAMARSFGTDATTLSLGISAYLVAIACFLPVSAWLSDRIGARTLMVASIGMFTLASMLCGFSPDRATFIAMRVVQGAAAALMSPTGRLVVLRRTPKPQLVHAIAVLTWPSLVAPILGPPLGGFLTTYLSWRWIFFLNLPIGLLGLALTLRYIPQQRAGERPPFDWLGFALAAVGLAGVIFGLELASALGEHALPGFALLVGGLVVIAVALRHLGRVPHPLVSLAPLRVKSFAISTLSGGTLTRIAVGATPFLLPLMFQSVFGYTAFAAGSLVLVYFAGNLAVKLVSTRLLRQFGFRTMLFANGVLLALATAACAWITSDPGVTPVALVLLTAGATRSLQFTALNTMTFADIAPEQAGAASTLSSLVQQIGVTLGVALAAFALHASMSGRGGGALSAADFRIAFLIVAAIAACALLAFSRLHPETGREVSGHRRAAPGASGREADPATEDDHPAP